MFCEYVNELPMVTDNLLLTRGGRLEFPSGHLRKAKADERGFRAFIIYDKARDVSYRITGDGMLVEYGETFGYQRTFIANPPDGVKHTSFAVEGDAAEVNSFLLLMDRMREEYVQRVSFIARAKIFMKEPLGRALLFVGLVYTIITLIILIHG